MRMALTVATGEWSNYTCPVMQQKRSRVVWMVAIFVAFFFFVDPFRLFTGNRMPTLRIDRETQNELAGFAAGADSAADAVVDLLRSADVVLIGETGYAREHVLFAAQLIPVLDSAGIHHLGYQYANREDQELVDTLTNSRTFDEELARRILFNHLTVLGFQEHVDLLRSAWEVNRRKGASDPRFRIIALSNRLNYEAITSEKDIENPEVMRRVFASGIPDSVMAQIISDEFLKANMKAVAFVQIEHAFTGFERPEYRKNMAALGFGSVNRAGNTLRARHGDRVVTAALHGPIQNSRTKTGFGYPAGGIIENVAKSLEEGWTLGFRVADSPFAAVTILSDVVTGGADEPVVLAGYADAYLVVAPITRLTAVTPIPDFINAANLDAAIRNFPGVKPGDVGVEDMNDFVAANAAGMARVFAAFK